MRFSFLALLCLFSWSPLLMGDHSFPLPSPSSETFAEPPNHTRWDQLLKQYVSPAGKVNYRGLKADKDQLQAYLNELAAHPVAAHWPDEEKMAYWINVYNAFTIKLILDHYPVKSITDIDGGNPWDVKWIRLGRQMYSLNQVENEILRPQFEDPRIHFAVNCAARSCPPLLNRAWTGDNLEHYLTQQTKAFINDPAYNRISPKKVEVSKIFEWYASDFGDLIGFLNRYSKVIIDRQATITYREYNWALNN